MPLLEFLRDSGRLRFEAEITAKIKDQILTQPEIDNCMAGFVQNMELGDSKTKIMKCASCGITGFHIDATKSSIHYKSTEHRWRHDLNIESFPQLKLSPEEYSKVANSPSSTYKNLFFPDKEFSKKDIVGPRECAYYLIPELVTLDDVGNFIISLCNQCYETLKKNAVPNFSILAGIDMGRNLHTLPTLTFLESLMISKSVIHLHCVKLKSGASALVGNCIVFPHDGLKIAKKLPRLDFDEFISVNYFGKLSADGATLDRIMSHKFFHVQVQKISKWLAFLKEFNPHYRDIILDDEYLELPNETCNARIRNWITKNLVREEKPDILFKDNVASASVMQDTDRQMDFSFMDMAATSATTEPDEIAKKSIDSLRASLSEAQFDIKADYDLPLNDYSENQEIFYNTFPNLFPLGCGMPNRISSTNWDRHLLLYFDQRFSTSIRFIFYLFNQKQRAINNKAAKSYVRNSATSIREISSLLADPDLDRKLLYAKNNPKSTLAKQLLSVLDKHIITTSAKSPFSASERKLSLAHLTAYTRFFGIPSFFITVTPSDIDSKLILALSGTKLTADYNTRAKLSVENPIAVVETFYRTINSMFEKLIGLSPDYLTKASAPCIEDRVKGILGLPVAFYGVMEVQGRGTLHIHFLLWSGVPPDVIQANTHSLASLIQSYFDSIVCANISVEKLGVSAEKTRYQMNPIDYKNFDKIAESYNTHSHSFSCVKPGCGKCRYGIPRRELEETQPIQLLGICPNTGKVITDKNIAPPQRTETLFQNDDRLIVWDLKRTNGKIVEFSPTLTASMCCNTNVSPITNDSSGKQTVFYLLKYMTKSPCEIAAATGIYYQARQQMLKYPSVYEGTNQCTRLVQSILHKINTHCEYSQNVCAAVLLGFPSAMFSHSTTYCFSKAAYDYFMGYKDEFGTSDNSIWNFPDVNNDDINFNVEPDTVVDGANIGDEHEPLTDFIPMDTFDLEKGHTNTPQHINYVFRGQELEHLNLYEYAALISIKPCQPKTKTIKKRRPIATTYDFDKEHPNYNTKTQYFNSKSKIPCIAWKGMPTYKKLFSNGVEANKWATFIATTFFPWGPHNSPISCEFNGVEQKLQEMEVGCEIDRFRYCIIRDTSIGLQTTNSLLKLSSIYRNEFAEQWSHSSIPKRQAETYTDSETQPKIDDFFELAKISKQSPEFLKAIDIVLDMMPPVQSTQTGNIESVYCNPLISKSDIVSALKNITGFPQSSKSLDDPANISTQYSLDNIKSIILSEDQQYVNDYVLSNTFNSQLLLFLSGGPGSGKSTLVRHMASRLHDSYLCCAPTGIAASLLPGGKTIDTLFNLPVRKSFEESIKAIQSINSDQFVLLQSNFLEKSIIIIDECSMIDFHKLYYIDLRLKQIFNNTMYFGGLSVIVMGDLFQLSPVGGQLWCDTVIDRDRFPEQAYMRLLMKSFKYFELSTQHRAKTDLVHTDMINTSRVSTTINASDIASNYKNITKNDYLLDPEWLNATIIVAGNEARLAYNKARAIQFSIQLGTPIVAWRKTCASQLDPNTLTSLYGCFPETIQYFVKGAPIILTANINVDICLANGTSAILHSICLSTELDQSYLDVAIPGEIVTISEPTSVNIQLPANYNFLPKSARLAVAEPVIPIYLGYTFEEVKFGSFKTSFKTFPFELKFALTYHKCQGQTLSRLIMDARLLSQGKAKFSFASFYVGLTRVRHSDNIRFAPMLPKDFANLKKLKPTQSVKTWLGLHSQMLNSRFKEIVLPTASSIQDSPSTRKKIIPAVVATKNPAIDQDSDFDSPVNKAKDVALVSLEGTNWLSNWVIDAYGNWFRQNRPQSLVFRTNFYPVLVARGYSGVQHTFPSHFFNLSVLCYPIRVLECHWICCVVLLTDFCVLVYDSMGGEWGSIATNIKNCLNEHLIATSRPIANWTINAAATCPQQRNGYDCGVFVCRIIDHCTQMDFNFNYDELTMQNYRNVILERAGPYV